MRMRIRFKNSIRSNLVMYTFALMMITTVLALYSLNIMNRYKDQIDTMFERHIYLSKLNQLLDEADENLMGFLTTKSSNRLNSFLINKEQLATKVNEKRLIAGAEEELILANIAKLVDGYLEETGESISYKRLRNVNKYYEHYQYSRQIREYIQAYIDDLNERQLSRNSESYLYFSKESKALEIISLIIIMDLVGLSIVLVYSMTSRMVRPFVTLSSAAEEISNGNLYTEDIQVHTFYELQVMASAFNKMKNSIQHNIEDLKQQAETEAQLKDEQMKNLKMEYLLENAKLYALQSQINPHFLFNTLNAGVQMSVMERAPKTEQFLDTLSSLFRYNIKKIDSSVIFDEEIDNIKDYYELLKVRFGSRINIEFDYDKSIQDLSMPPLILQPLVENAYIHGLSGLEHGGTISIHGFMDNEAAIIIVKDDGKGMNPERLEEIMNGDENSKVGIGVRNVRERLGLFYRHCSCFQIESEEGAGTTITITIHISDEGGAKCIV